MNGSIRLHEKLVLIEQIPLFNPLSPEEKDKIASSSAIVEFKKGDIVYHQGDAPDAFYGRRD